MRDEPGNVLLSVRIGESNLPQPGYTLSHRGLPLFFKLLAANFNSPAASFRSITFCKDSRVAT